MEINGVIFTDAFTNATFLLFKVKAAVVNIGDQRNGLREVYMNSFIARYILIKLIGILDWAVFDAGRATRAFALDNVSGLLDQGYRKVSRLPFYTVDFSIAQDLYIWMPADLDQFRRKYSHGTVISGIGLVKLGHMAANGG